MVDASLSKLVIALVLTTESLGDHTDMQLSCEKEKGPSNSEESCHFADGDGINLLQERINLQERTALAGRTSTKALLKEARGQALDAGKGDFKPFADEEEPAFKGVKFSSGMKDFDVAFELALSELSQNHVDEGGLHLIAGSAWESTWTRDTSYTASLAGALLSPKASMASLRKSTSTVPDIGTVWLQDECGHFGGWPALTDSIVGAQGAWSVYLATGDHDFLSWARNVTRNTLRRAENDVYDRKSHLFRGCSSFMESNSGYPAKYSNTGSLVAQTKALSTNMLYYIGYKVAASMVRELDGKKDEIQEFEKKAAKLRDAIRSEFWLSDKGYYSYFQDENGQPVEQMEGLGESLTLLAPQFESDADRIDSIFAKTFRSSMGIPCLWPPFGSAANSADFTEEYHNGRVWPFVQGYWAMAAARHGRVDVFNEEMDKLVQLSKLQNTFAEYYNPDGSFADGHARQLWSDAGFLSMVYHGLFGIVLEPNSMRFSPVKPHGMMQTIFLKNVKYRGTKLDVYVTGTGSKIKSFKVDGKVQADPVIEAASKTASTHHPMRGSHTVEIILDSNWKPKSVAS